MGALNSELTVVTCSKNDISGLKRTLESLTNFRSDMPKLVLVLSDYSETEIELIKSEFNMLSPDIYQINSNGIYNAQNFGLNIVKTRLMLVLNGGDSLISPKSLENLVDKIGKRDWGYGACRFVDPNLGSARVYKYLNYSRLLHRLGLRFVPHPSVVVDADKARKFGGFDLHYKIAADQKMILQFANTSAPVTIPEIIASFELGGASSRKSIEIVSDFRRISNEIFGYFFNSKVVDKIVWFLVLTIRQNLGR